MKKTGLAMRIISLLLVLSLLPALPFTGLAKADAEPTGTRVDLTGSGFFPGSYLILKDHVKVLRDHESGMQVGLAASSADEKHFSFDLDSGTNAAATGIAVGESVFIIDEMDGDEAYYALRLTDVSENAGRLRVSGDVLSYDDRDLGYCLEFHAKLNFASGAPNIRYENNVAGGLVGATDDEGFTTHKLNVPILGGRLTGKLKEKLTVDFDFKFNDHMILSGGLDWALENAKLSLPDVSVSPKEIPLFEEPIFGFPSLGLQFQVAIVIEVEAGGEIEFEASGYKHFEIGFRGNLIDGIEPVHKVDSSDPPVDIEMESMESEIEVFFGLSIGFCLDFAEVIKGTAGFYEGFSLYGKYAKRGLLDQGKRWHICDDCIEGGLHWKGGFRVNASVFWTTQWEEKAELFDVPIFDWYYSITYGDGGLTLCPHCAYRLTINIKDQKNKPVSGARLSYTPPDDHIPEEMCSGTTGSKGSVDLYFPIEDVGRDVSLKARANGVDFDLLCPMPPETGYTPGTKDLARPEVTLTLKSVTLSFVDPETAHEPASNMPASQKFISGSMVTIPENIPTKPGMHFTGWTHLEGDNRPEKELDPGSTGKSLFSDLTLYACWENEYTLTFADPRESEGKASNMPEPVTFYNGEIFNLPENIPTKTGKYFAGWSQINDNVPNEKVYPGASGSFQSNITLYACWSDADPMFTLCFVDRKESERPATGMPEDIRFFKNQIVTIPERIPEKADKHFTGWTQISDSGKPEKNLDPGASGPLAANLTLYACWEDLYTLEFVDPKDSEGKAKNMPENIRFYKGQTFTIPKTQPNKDGVRFIGWSQFRDNVPDPRVDPGSTGTLGANLTLYACWEHPYTITFVDRETETGTATGMPDPISFYKGDYITIPDNVPRKDRRYFTGWTQLLDNVPDKRLYPGAQGTLERDLELYACWADSDPRYLIGFEDPETDHGAARNMPKPFLFFADQEVVIPLVIPGKDDLHFTGWSTSKNNVSQPDLDPGSRATLPAGNLILYACWEELLTVDFVDPDTAHGQAENLPSSMRFFKWQTITIPGQQPTKRGMRFTGWSQTDDNVPNDRLRPYSTGSFGESTTLYACWEDARGTLTFVDPEKAHGQALVMPDDVRFIPGEDVRIPAIYPTKTGLRFTGWSDSDNGTPIAALAPGSVAQFNGDTTLYACWEEPEKCVMIFTDTETAHGQAENLPDAIEFAPNETVTIPSLVPTKQGMRFIGWSTLNDNRPDAKVAPGSTGTPTSSITLYACWQELYTVTFADKETAHGTAANMPEDIEFEANQEVTIPENIPTKEGLEFIGWTNLGDNVPLEKLAPGKTGTFGGNITIYACWQETAEKFTVTFTDTETAHGQALVMPDDITFIAGDDVRIPAIYPTKTGLRFTGWSDSDNGTPIAALAPGSVTKFDGDTTLYACWEEPEKCVMIFTDTETAHGQAENLPDAIEFAPNETVTIPSLVPTKQGMRFIGWSTLNDNRPDAKVAPGSTGTPTSSITLYACWKELYTVTFADKETAHGTAENMPKAIEFEANQEVTIPENIPTKEGLEFIGWTNLGDNVPLEKLAPGKTGTFGGSITIYACWKEAVEKFTVTFTDTETAHGTAANMPEAIEFEANQDVTIPEGIPTKQGLTFTGWSNLDNNVPVASLAPGSTTTFDGNTTLYACWQETAEKFAVTFSDTETAHGTAANMPEAIVFEANQNVTIPEGIPTKQGLTFSGWSNLDNNVPVASLAPGNTTTFDGNTTLYACWKETAEKFTVTFADKETAHGTAANMPEAIEFEANQDVTIPEGIPTKQGLTFTGWSNLDNNVPVASLAPGSTTTFDGNTTLYACWQETAEKFTVTFTDTETAHGTAANMPAAIEFEANQDVTIPEGIPTKRGLTFSGWSNLDNNTPVEKFAPGSTTTFDGSITLYACWQETAEKFTVTFTDTETAHGTAANMPEAIDFEANQDVTIPEGIPTKQGLTFSGWSNLDNNVPVASLAPGSTTTFDGNIMLYACWEKLPDVTIRFDANGGTFADGSTAKTVTVPYQSALRAQDIPASPTRKGHDVLGWSLAPNAAQPETVDTTSARTADAVYYAVYRMTAYQVTVTVEGFGKASATPTQAHMGDRIALTWQPGAQQCFTGWQVISGDVKLEDDSFVMPDSDVALCAVFEYAPASMMGIIEQPKDQTVGAGARVEFRVAAAGVGLTYQWYVSKAGGPFTRIAGATLPTYSLTVEDKNDGDRYYCLVTNEKGWQLRSDEAVLRINAPAPPIPVTGDAAPLALWITALFASMAGILFLRRRKRA